MLDVHRRLRELKHVPDPLRAVAEARLPLPLRVLMRHLTRGMRAGLYAREEG